MCVCVCVCIYIYMLQHVTILNEMSRKSHYMDLESRMFLVKLFQGQKRALNDTCVSRLLCIHILFKPDSANTL